MASKRSSKKSQKSSSKITAGDVVAGIVGVGLTAIGVGLVAHEVNNPRPVVRRREVEYFPVVVRETVPIYLPTRPARPILPEPQRQVWRTEKDERTEVREGTYSKVVVTITTTTEYDVMDRIINVRSSERAHSSYCYCSYCC